jgi:hypothetical protein
MPATGAATTARPVTTPTIRPAVPSPKAAAVVEVDHLEGEDRAPADVVQEDPDLDDPELAREAERQPLGEIVIVQRSTQH